MKPILYFAPMNHIGNHLYRHLLLKNGVDYVFSELFRVDRIDLEKTKGKFKIFEDDVSKTIFQIAAGSKEEIETGITRIKKEIPKIKEINLNLGCPQATMIKAKLCGGILCDLDLMGSLLESLFHTCTKLKIKPSVKIRTGTDQNTILLEKYMKLIQKSGIKKVYIHARTLRHPYSKSVNTSPLESINKLFPDLELIYNGDIDSFESFNLIINNPNLSFDKFMIGRAALHNPLIFKQIKNKQLLPKYSNSFDPLLNDFSVIKRDGGRHLAEEKYDFILGLINLAKRENEFEMIKKNLAFLTKGLSNHKRFMELLYLSKGIDELKDVFLETLSPK